MTHTPVLENALVIDVSRWQHDLKESDFREAKEKAGLVGVIAKFTQGGTWVDSMGPTHLWNAKEAGVDLLGAYCFGDHSEPRAQADHFLKTVKADFPDGLNGVLLALDLEANNHSTMTVAQAEVFVQCIHDGVGRWPVIYCGKYGPDGRGTGLPSYILSACSLWLPRYSSPDDLTSSLPPGFHIPKDDLDYQGALRLHQKTDGTINGGPVPGIGRVDQSDVIGFSTMDALKAWWGN